MGTHVRRPTVNGFKSGARGMSDSVIAVEDLSKRYGRGQKAVDALRGVSISVTRGEIYGLLGRNGAGKTTLVKILLDIVRADRGSARILGRSTRTRAARIPVGYLPEDHRFAEYQTGEGALAFYASLSNFAPRDREQRFRDLLELVDLAGAARRKIRTYSKGMKQRLGLAQALVHDPRILFLDEPTDGVDPVGRAKIRDILLSLKAEGKTIFLNSHLLSEIERVCDRVGILEAGCLVREGTVDELTTTDLVFTVKTDPPPDEALRAGLAHLVEMAAVTPEGLEVKVARETDVDAVVDFLRARRVGIRSIVEKRLSLETVFLEVIDRNGTSPAGGAP
jgi:ABC-2 type transport system ATP-binding protein